MGKIYEQLSIEERTMIQTQLEMGIKPAAIAAGLNLFIASYRFERPILKLYRATLPFFFLLLGAVLVITYWPSLSLFLIE